MSSPHCIVNDSPPGSVPPISYESMRLANQHVDVEGGTIEAAAQVLLR